MTTAGELHLDGRIDGDLDAREAVIGEAGRVEGHVRGDSITVRGEVRGTIAARSVRIEKTGIVTGDISYASIGIESGARVAGRFVLNVAEDEAAPAPLQLTVVAGGD